MTNLDKNNLKRNVQLIPRPRPYQAQPKFINTEDLKNRNILSHIFISMYNIFKLDGHNFLYFLIKNNKNLSYLLVFNITYILTLYSLSVRILLLLGVLLVLLLLLVFICLNFYAITRKLYIIKLWWQSRLTGIEAEILYREITKVRSKEKKGALSIWSRPPPHIHSKHKLTVKKLISMYNTLDVKNKLEI